MAAPDASSHSAHSAPSAHTGTADHGGAGKSSASVPAKAAGQPGATGLSHFVLISKDDAVWVKFTCPCGQRLLFPTHKPDRVGRCGRCGREHRMVGMERRIASFEERLHAADDGPVTRLLDPANYLDAAPDGSNVRGAIALIDSIAPPPPEPPAAPPRDDFQSFYNDLIKKDAPPPPVESASETAAISESAIETVDVPPPSARNPAAAGPAGTASVAVNNPEESGFLTDLAMSPMEPLNSARVRETADLAADRLRPRSTQVEAVQPSGLIWAWPPATPFARVLASGLDLILPALGALTAAYAARQWEGQAVWRLAYAYGALVLVGLGLDLAGALIGYGASLGKRIAGIHVRRETGNLPGFLGAAGRSAVKWLSTPVLWPLCFLNANGQTLHDRLCGTRVLFGRPRN